MTFQIIFPFPFPHISSTFEIFGGFPSFEQDTTNCGVLLKIGVEHHSLCCHTLNFIGKWCLTLQILDYFPIKFRSKTPQNVVSYQKYQQDNTNCGDNNNFGQNTTICGVLHQFLVGHHNLQCPTQNQGNQQKFQRCC